MRSGLSLQLYSPLNTYFQVNSPVLCPHPRLAILCLLRAKLRDFAAHFGMKCSSFCSMNRGTSKRTACSSTGFTEYVSVRVSNMLGERRRVQNIFCMGLQVIPSKLVSNPIPNQQPWLPWKDLPFGSFDNFLRGGVDTWAARWIDLWVSASIPIHASKHIWSWRDSRSSSSLKLYISFYFPKSNLETFLFQQDNVVFQWHHDKSHWKPMGHSVMP